MKVTDDELEQAVNAQMLTQHPGYHQTITALKTKYQDELFDCNGSNKDDTQRIVLKIQVLNDFERDVQSYATNLKIKELQEKNKKEKDDDRYYTIKR